MNKPILFKTPMIRALLHGVKTQTRRIIKPQPKPYQDETFKNVCPHGKIGDYLWVRETTEVDEEYHDIIPLSKYVADGKPVLYTEYNGSVAHWTYSRLVRPSIHMPRWASRLTLRIKDIRIERLQDISESDAEVEGVCRYFFTSACTPANKTFKNDYRILWNDINGEASWDENPWVWVIEFDVIKLNIDELLNKNK